jgi:propionate CoA-transferase
MGGFTAGGLDVEVFSGKLRIVREGDLKKFVNSVDEITFSGEYATATNKEVLYITERAVFKLTKKGLTMIEIAPGIDVEKDILAQMEFKPQIADVLNVMDKRIFKEDRMSIRGEILSKAKKV